MKYQGKITDPKDLVTKEYVDTGLSGKLGTSGDGSNVTAAFTAASSRTNISTGEKLSVIFGKIAKWFADLGAAAFRGVDAAPTANSTNLVESGGVKSALDNVETSLSNDSAFSTLTGNGYIKFPDGTMMQWGRAEAYVTFTAWGNMYESSAISIGDFPIAFVGEKPVMQVSLNNSGSAAFGARVGGDYPTLTSGGSVFVYRPNNPGTTTACIGWLAIGRWKI